MNQYDLAIEATKIIVQHCTNMKLEFAEKLEKAFTKSKNLKFPILPQKRQVSPEQENTPESGSSEESPSKADSLSKLKKLKIEETLLRVYSSDTDGEISTIIGLEYVINELKVSDTQHMHLEMIDRYLDSFEVMGLRERKLLASVLDQFKTSKFTCRDSKAKAVFAKVQEKVKKVFSCESINEDWDDLYENAKSAIECQNNSRVSELIRRIYSAFPSEINRKMSEELSPLISIIKPLQSSSESSEIKVKISKILEKWERKNEKKYREKFER